MKLRISSALGIMLFLPILGSVCATSTARVVVYTVYGCSVCSDDPIRRATVEYYPELTRALKEMAITDVPLRLTEMDPEARQGTDELFQRLGAPESMKGTIVVSTEEKFLFVRVPVEIVIDFSENHAQKHARIIVFRDELRNRYNMKD